MDCATITELLNNNNVLISSTDTVLGLLAPVTDKGFTALNTIKKRSSKPYLIMISDFSKVAHFSDQKLTPEIEALLKKAWPGPLTVILKAKKDLPGYMTSSKGTVALRVPNHKSLLSVLQHFDGLFSTSANLTGQAVPESFENIDKSLVEHVVALVGQTIDKGHHYPVIPSTIIDCSDNSIKVIRQGTFKQH